MAASKSMKKVPWEPVQVADPTEDTAPELVWLVDTTDGLDAFAPRLDRPRVIGPARAKPAVQPASEVPPDRVWAVNTADGLDAFAPETPGFDWKTLGTRAAVVGAFVAAAATGILLYQQPRAPAPPSARLAAPAIAAPATEARLQPDPLVSVESAPPPIVVEPPAPLAAPLAAPVENGRVGTADVSRSAPTAAASDVGARNTLDVAPAAPRPLPAPAPVLALPPRGFVIDPLPGTPEPTTGSIPAVAEAPAPAPPAPVAPTVADVPPTAAVAAPPRETESDAIENVLGRYREAFNRLDAGAAAVVWPTVNEKNLARAFERLDDQQVSFATCTIEVKAVRAEAACSGSARYVPKVGNRAPRSEARRWNFSLRKASGGWLIDRVDAR